MKKKEDMTKYCIAKPCWSRSRDEMIYHVDVAHGAIGLTEALFAALGGLIGGEDNPLSGFNSEAPLKVCVIREWEDETDVIKQMERIER